MKKTLFNELHKKLGGKMIEFVGVRVRLLILCQSSCPGTAPSRLKA